MIFKTTLKVNIVQKFKREIENNESVTIRYIIEIKYNISSSTVILFQSHIGYLRIYL